MKKLLAWLVCLALLIPVLAGCSNTPQGTSQQATNSNIGQKAPDDYTITIGLPTQSLVEDYETNGLTQWLEEESGYSIDFVLYASIQRDYQAQITTEFQLPDWKMPDILWGMDMGQQAINDLGVGGDIIDLAPYFNNPEYSQKWWDRLNQIDDKDFIEYITRKMYADDGKAIYAFPGIEYSTFDMIRHNAFINQEWLDKLNLPMPTNTDELYNTLVAFRDLDPNGNGEKDEVPLVGAGSNQYGDVISWILNMFCYIEDARTWRVDENGKISGFYWDEEYRKGLIFLNKLVKEGLMPDYVLTANAAQLKQLVNPVDGVETVGIWLGHPQAYMLQDCESAYVYKAMPQWGNVIMNMGTNKYDTMITSDCAYPDAAWEIFMLMSSAEGGYRMRYGVKGVDWVDATPGTKSFVGLDAEIRVINHTAYGGANNSTWNSIRACIGLACENERSEFSDSLDEWTKAKYTAMAESHSNNWAKYNADGGRPSNVVMPLIYTVEEEREVSIWRTNTNNWYKNCRASFIKGSGELNDPANDAQWQKYIDGFKTQGYYDWLNVAQDVYDFTFGNKSGK